MAEQGEELSQLHLLKSKTLDKPIVKYKGNGEDLIEKPGYVEESACIFINNKKYFEGITPEMWNYHIGGYQVLEKYLKDRKGRPMTDSATYCKIAAAISATISIQKRLEPLFDKIENTVIDSHV